MLGKSLGTSACKRRRGSGQALLEGVFSLYILVLVMCAATILLFTVGAISYYKIKLSLVAASAAKQAVQSTYWLGAVRPGYQPQNVQEQTINTVQEAAIAVGLPEIPDDNITVTQDLADSKLCIVKVTMDYIPFLNGDYLPIKIPIIETAAEPYLVDSPTGLLALGFDVGGGAGRGFFVPCYGRGVNMQNGQVAPAPNLDSTQPEGTYPTWQTTSIPTGPIYQIGGHTPGQI